MLIGSSPEVIADAKSLIRWCLKGNPAERPTIEEMLSHRYLNPESEVAALEMPMKYHMFISHVQIEASGDCGTLFFLLRQLGVRCWRDMNADDLTEAGMRQGVYDSECFVLFLTNAVLSRTFCLKELTWALEFEKKIIVIVEREVRSPSLTLTRASVSVTNPLGWD